MSRLTRGVERLLARGGAELRHLREILGEDVVADEMLEHIVGRVKAEDLHVIREVDRLRIRPVLVTLSARAAGAAAVDSELQHAAELLHLALTMHDLTLGQPGGRRRRVARRVLKRVGTSHLSVRALELARHVSPPDVMGEAVDTLRAFADGENLTREHRESAEMPARRDVDEHADVHHGAVLAFCCRAGAQAAGADVPTVAALGRYGRHMGRLWTLADDLVSMTSEDAEGWLMGRVMAGRPVMAATAAAERDPEVAVLWSRVVREGRPEDVKELLERTVRAGGLQDTREAMARASWTARQALRSVPESPYREGLDILAAGIARAS